MKWWRIVGRTVVRHNVWVATGCLAVMAFFLVGIVSRIETSVSIKKLFSKDAEIIHHYTWLEKHLGPLVPMEIVLKFNNEECKLSIVDRMRIAQAVERTVETQLGDKVGGALSAAVLAPDIRPDRSRSSLVLRAIGMDRRQTRESVLNKRLERNRAEFREYLTVDTDRLLHGRHGPRAYPHIVPMSRR